MSINEKETMQHLNQRLSSYLDKVHSLEQENTQLEKKICEWYANNAPTTLPDSSQYFRTIQDLQNEIVSTNVDNARIVLQIDNAQLAADDLRNKYEMEFNSRRSVEADVGSLRRALEELNMQRQDLEIQVRCLQEELHQLKSNHEEEVNSLRTQLGARVNVEVDAAPSIDLNKVLSEVREQYENLMERNLREVESIFLARSEELNSEVSSGAEQLESVSNDLIDLKRSAQTLEIEFQSQLSMKSALENTLAETESTFGSQLAQLQAMIDNIESQLGQVRSDLERHNYEYKLLMDQKTHLEMEIATYKQLLDGHDIHVPAHQGIEYKEMPKDYCASVNDKLIQFAVKVSNSPCVDNEINEAIKGATQEATPKCLDMFLQLIMEVPISLTMEDPICLIMEALICPTTQEEPIMEALICPTI
ncbi:keratin, type I cytoskeletal 19-like [Dendropsophus ebraccatus]|uniref:keratin, type I cytoskeletal 19-like n=1 Tax=Dendropsophus ebraccatus TaxID=150705 RepID=UPI0038312C3F